jgi:hypothetical protein
VPDTTIHLPLQWTPKDAGLLEADDAMNMTTCCWHSWLLLKATTTRSESEGGIETRSRSSISSKLMHGVASWGARCRGLWDIQLDRKRQ